MTALAERRYTMLKVILMVALLAFAVFIASIILDKEGFGDLPETDVDVFVYTTWFSAALFVIAMVGASVIFIKGPRKQHKGIQK